MTDGKPTGLLRLLLRAPIWLYRVGLGRFLGHRLLYVVHRGRRTGARREVVVEIVRYDAHVPEAVVVAAWGKDPDWYRNLLAGPALEVRLGGQRWLAPEHRSLDVDEVLDVLLSYPRDASPRVAVARAETRLPGHPGRPAMAGRRGQDARDRLHAACPALTGPERS